MGKRTVGWLVLVLLGGCAHEPSVQEVARDSAAQLAGMEEAIRAAEPGAPRRVVP